MQKIDSEKWDDCGDYTWKDVEEPYELVYRGSLQCLEEVG
jgi:hypothetical protein